MTDQHTTSDGARSSPSPGDEEMVRLLEHAGHQQDVPAEHLADIKAAFRAEWEAHVAATRQRRRDGARRGLLAAAAVLVLAVVAAWWAIDPGSPPARIETVTGVATLRAPDEDGAGSRLQGGEAVPPRAIIDTTSSADAAPARTALRLAGGASLRLDRDTRIRLVSATIVELEKGGVYVDSAVQARGTVSIRTPLGTARDVGTQFEVRLLDGSRESGPRMQVRVREGLVRIALDGAAPSPRHDVEAGGEVIVHADGTVESHAISTFGGDWQWVLEIAPPFAQKGGSLAEVLTWAGRETGWRIRYEDEALAASATKIPILGALADVHPDEAQEVIRAAGLASRLEGGVLVVSRR